MEVLMAPEDIIRRSAVAGSFYPGDPEILSRQIEGYLSNVKPLDIKGISALVSPHAGYIYSGQVAAYSFRQVLGEKYNSIIIIAPSHTEYFDFISVYHGDAYETPLGLAAVDMEGVLKLEEASPLIERSHSGHGSEHSLEVQLPFLQIVLGEDLKIIPVVIGNQSPANITALGEAIGNTFSGENILIVASTDLSHYHPYDTAVSLDSQVQNIIEKFDSSKLIRDLSREEAEMCGGGPVASAMIASKLMGSDSSIILNYANSGDVSGDRSAVVGYLSAAFYKK
jgi:AmmeMemoRadiSam system protein B